MLGSQLGATCYQTNNSTNHQDLSDFHHWRIAYNKTYTGEKNLAYYFKNWLHNRDYVEIHNAKHNDFKLGLNQFADINTHRWEEAPHYNQRLAERKFTEPHYEKEDLSLPKHVDWRPKGVVTPVKNQQQCGSCWAFSATGSMEGQHALKTGKLVSLSESQIVDCAKQDNGCGGGWMDDAFTYVIASKGIEPEKDYPYVPLDEPCTYNVTEEAATFTGFHDVKGGEAGLKKAVATVGPVSVAIDASWPDFQLYKSGVYYNPDCSTTNLDHGVLAVGYGTTQNGTDYWIVKNSWGDTWGNKGYIWMARNRNNNCGIATQPSYPLV
jgi:cathepsin L